MCVIVHLLDSFVLYSALLLTSFRWDCFPILIIVYWLSQFWENKTLGFHSLIYAQTSSLQDPNHPSKPQHSHETRSQLRAINGNALKCSKRCLLVE